MVLHDPRPCGLQRHCFQCRYQTAARHLTGQGQLAIWAAPRNAEIRRRKWLPWQTQLVPQLLRAFVVLQLFVLLDRRLLLLLSIPLVLRAVMAM